ncbi:D-glycero-D-manno-heptose 1-phosphate guanosyltransferase [Neiella marina]|uniref:D-glycero-D-manno-heptose 1-phosphate guanosyltransferase n=1 Tax=Neiella marina TaxID=508461 RepID=A0A8J2U9A9_9GAMM|nr:bifunctional diguanylate cyclase/phosphodiesterase [Neiella marina]GGA88056.1 D-glycero-D-manno-heptose 1-phosphate guanosyltransferase [Neiella marina]
MSQRHPLYDELTSVIVEQKITSLFQPLVHLRRGSVIGYEALSRGPSDSPLHSPAALFDVAQQTQRLSKLDLLCRLCAIRRFVEFDTQALLFINVSPVTLLSEDHPRGRTLELLDQYGLRPEQVVIELSEQHRVDCPKTLRQAVEHYRKLGFLIAIDDLGAGFSGLKLWSELRPDIIKIDRYFVSQIHSDPLKKEFVRSIVSLAQTTGSKVVAEGIETDEELIQVQELGIDYGQGYLLGHPQPEVGLEPVGVYKIRNERSASLQNLSDTANQLLSPALAVSHDVQVGQVVDRFLRDPSLQSIAVTEGKVPAGIVQRATLLELFSTPYGRSLNERRPISQVMQLNPVVVEADTPLEVVSRTVTDEESFDVRTHFIITASGQYKGLGSVRSLLRRITESRLQSARYANPLTMLPGNVPIYREVERLLHKPKEFTFAYLDLNNFKPYNDVYGYGRGDMVIQLVAELLKSHAAGPGNFVGHVGGDDFVAIMTTDNWQQRCELILQDFDARISHYYEQADVEQGGVYARTRSGKEQFFPLLGLAIGAVQPDLLGCHSHHEIAALAADAKKEAKRSATSSLFISRRRIPNQGYAPTPPLQAVENG